MRVVLMVWGLCVIVMIAPLLAAEDPGAEPGVYLGQLEAPLCGLESSSGFRPPSIPEVESVPHVTSSELKISVRLGEAEPGRTVEPRNLRLVRVDEGAVPMFRVVAVDNRYDAADPELVHVGTGELEDGMYALAVERPGWAAGLTEMDRVMEFLDCFFVVDSAMEPAQEDAAGGETSH